MSQLEGLAGEALVLSASKEVEPGVRIALLLAEGLFRLDAVVEADVLQTIVRNLSPGALRMLTDPARSTEPATTTPSGAAYRPSGTVLAFELGEGADTVAVTVVLGTLRLEHSGTYRLTAQATVRRRP